MIATLVGVAGKWLVLHPFRGNSAMWLKGCRAVAEGERVCRVFVSSPSDVAAERGRVDLVVERLNAEFRGRVRIQTVRWETQYYSAHATFQNQIPEAADCDIVVALFRSRLGTALPDDFPFKLEGKPYPSGTAYELLSAIAARQTGKDLPDIYVFRHPHAPSLALDAPDRAEVEAQWGALKGFFDSWFRTEGGGFKAAFQDYGSTDDFAAKLEDCVRQWLARHGFAAQGPVWDRTLRGSPFPGLEAFGAERESVFFGRELALAQTVAKLRGAPLPFLLVIGASGAGKSSLLRAGLLPRLVRPGEIPEVDLWRSALVLPGAKLFAALAESLLADAALGPELRGGPFGRPERLASLLGGEPADAAAVLRAALDGAAKGRQAAEKFEAPRPARLLLAVDQAERLFTEAEPAEADAFAGLAARLVRDNVATLVMALRSDAYPRFQATAPLVALREEGAVLDLLPPSPAELEEMVERPVAACEPPLRFEEENNRSLAARLVAETKGGDALPLLQMTLRRLYEAEEARGDGTLRFADYRGLSAAVSETADGALAEAERQEPQARGELPALIAGLVSDVATDAEGKPLPVLSPLDRGAFEANNPARRALVGSFVANRLLTAEGNAASERVRPVHEALLRIWPEAVRIVAETGNLLRVRHALAPLAREWQEAPQAQKAAHLDIPPALLAGAQDLLARFGADLPATTRAFVAASAEAAQARERQKREAQEQRLRDAESLAAAHRRTALFTRAGLVLALVLAALAGWQWWEAQKQTQLAEKAAREAQAQRDRAGKAVSLATETANGLVFDLAQKFNNAKGVPAGTIRDILDRARKLQDALASSGEVKPDLRRSQAAALGRSAVTLLSVGETTSALEAAEKSLQILQEQFALEPDNIDGMYNLSAIFGTIGSIKQTQNNLPEAKEYYKRGLEIDKKLTLLEPNNPEWKHNLAASLNSVGDIQLYQHDLEGALASYGDSLAIIEKLAEADPAKAEWQRALAAAHMSIGEVERWQNNFPAALASYEMSVDIIDKLTKADPNNTDWQSGLAIALVKVGDFQHGQDRLDEALDSFRASFAIRTALADSDPDNLEWQSDLLQPMERIAKVQMSQGAYSEALGSYQNCLEIARKLTVKNPDNADWKRALSVFLTDVGEAQWSLGRSAEALASFRSGLAINEQLSRADPTNAAWQMGVAVSYDRLGYAQMELRRFPEALTSYQAALGIRQRLAEASPADSAPQRVVAMSFSDVGDAYAAQGDTTKALASYESALALRRELLTSGSTDEDPRNDLAASLQAVANIHLMRQDLAQALSLYQERLSIRKEVAAEDAGNRDRQLQLAEGLVDVADIQALLGESTEALASYQQASTIFGSLEGAGPGSAEGERRLLAGYEKIGDAQVKLGQIPEAVATYQSGLEYVEKLADADPGNAEWLRGLAVSCVKVAQIDPSQARPMLLRAREIFGRMQANGQLAPEDEWMVANLDKRIAALPQ